MDRPMSAEWYERGIESLVGGVNSPVRSFRAVGIAPVFAARGEGPYLFDVDDNRYIDYLMSWGPLLLGHAPEAVRVAVAEAAARGTSYGLSTREEVRLAELVRDAVPSIDRLRLVSSGTEAVMSAVRLARGATGRSKIVMFAGCYHGHSDGLLAQAGSGLATFAMPASAGVPPSFAAETLVAKYNDLDSVEAYARTHRDDIAAILVEPVAGNMGVVPPRPRFLAGLRAICDNIGALLIFDEVITGFRVAWGGAQTRFAVQPDLTTLGKILGGGLPLAAFGGRAEVMQKLAPCGDVYQAGTLSGNPLAVCAGRAVLEAIRRAAPYAELERKSRLLEDGLVEAAQHAGVPLSVNRVGSMLSPFFTDEPVVDQASGKAADGRRYASFFRYMLEAGVLLPPSPWESWFVSTAHSDADITRTIELASHALGKLASAATS